MILNFYYYFLLLVIIPDKIEYDVWYTGVLIDSLRVIHMKIPIQVILHRIG